MDQSPAAAVLRLVFKKKALISAVTTGDTETVVDLLDGGVPIDTKNDEGVSLLHWAARGGHLTTMRLLIRRGCDVDSVDSKGLTPLHWAAANGQTKAVRELIRNDAAKSKDAGEFGTPLHQAAKKGHVETVVAMLEENCSIRVVNSVGATVLHCAAEGGHVQVVRELVIRGCDVNAVKTNGCTPLHLAAAHGRTEAVRELIKLGAHKSVDAGVCGTPLHSGALGGSVDTVKALLEEEKSGPDLSKHDVTTSKAQASEYNVIGTCDSVGVTPIMSAVLFGQVEMFKFLASKGGDISDIDAYSLSTLEHCFIGGQASKLGQFCDACGIKGSGDGLRGALASLITQGLIDAHKVLCLCAISGDSIFLNDQFIEIVARDACAMPAAVKCAKFYFFKGGVPFLNQLSLPDGSSLSPLHIALLSFKCLKMGFAGNGSSVEYGAKDHTAFITQLLSHPVLKETVHENFPNGLSPLDLAQQFEFHHIAALIEKAGGCSGVWAKIPRDFYSKHHLKLLTAYVVLNSVCWMENGGQEAKNVFINILGEQSVEGAVHAADNYRCLTKVQVWDQHPDLRDIVRYVLPRIQVRHWKRVGLSLGMKKRALDELGQQFSSDDDRYLETLSLWIEQGKGVTWKTLLEVLGLFETENTVDELKDKIVSVLGEGQQVTLQLSTPIEETRSKRTAQLIWPPAKQRQMFDAEVLPSQRKRSPGNGMQDHSPAKTALIGSGEAERRPPVCEATQVLGAFRDQFIADMDANTVVWELLHKGIISRGVQERISRTDEPKQRNEILHDYLQRTCTKEAMIEVCDITVAVKGHTRMHQLGEAMKKRLHTATPVQVVQGYTEDFIEKMNSKVLAPQLKELELIPEAVECAIDQSRSKEEANGHLLKHLKEDADEKTVREVFRIASEKAGYGKMKAFATGMLRELQ